MIIKRKMRKKMSQRSIPRINFSVRRELLRRMFREKVEPPNPFVGAVEKYYGLGRKLFPNLTPSKIQELLREVRECRE